MIPASAYLCPAAGGPYSRQAYYADPSSYSSTFNRDIAPYLTTLINGAGWQPGSPRIMSCRDLDGLVASVGADGQGHKLVAVQDVACDLKVI